MTFDMVATLIVYAALAIAFTYVVTKDIPHEERPKSPDALDDDPEDPDDEDT